MEIKKEEIDVIVNTIYNQGIVLNKTEYNIALLWLLSKRTNKWFFKSEKEYNFFISNIQEPEDQSLENRINYFCKFLSSNKKELNIEEI